MWCEPGRTGAPAGGDARVEIGPIEAGAAARTEARDYLRIGGSDEDAAIDRLVAAAVAHGEAFTARLWLARTVRETLAAAGEWRRLGATPVRAVTAAESIAIDGAASALAPASYAIDIDAAGDGWVRATAFTLPRLRLTYQAGLAPDWASLPEPLRHGAIRLASHLYAHRDGADERGPPAAVAALWRPWRRMRLA